MAYSTQHKKYSPGNLLTQFVLENMLDYGMNYYDSGVDGDHYKKYITNVRTPLGIGSIYPTDKKMNLQHISGSAWNVAENSLPSKLSNTLQRTRRRSEQILATEQKIGARVKGYLHALNRPPHDS